MFSAESLVNDSLKWKTVVYISEYYLIVRLLFLINVLFCICNATSCTLLSILGSGDLE